MKIKYLEQRQRANGKTIWVVNPTKVVKDALEVSYTQFETRKEAERFATQIAEAYDDYKHGRRKRIRHEEGTVNGLILFYKTTNAYQRLTDNSKSAYELMIKTAVTCRLGEANTVFGNMKASGVSPTHADTLYRTIQEHVSPHRANHVCKVMRRIWFVGKRHAKVSSNPFEKMGLKGLEDRVVLWQPEQVDLFIKTADEMNIGSIGTLALLCYDLCQRPGDMRQITWGSYNNGHFEFKQEKTGTIMSIPASPRLMSRLESIKSNNVSLRDHMVICEATQKPYDRRLYAKYAARVRNAANLPSELQLRDLRRTGATEMAEAGCTEDELRSVTGHQSRDVLSIYVRPTDKLAASGINKRFSR